MLYPDATNTAVNVYLIDIIRDTTDVNVKISLTVKIKQTTQQLNNKVK